MAKDYLYQQEIQQVREVFRSLDSDDDNDTHENSVLFGQDGLMFLNNKKQSQQDQNTDDAEPTLSTCNPQIVPKQTHVRQPFLQNNSQDPSKDLRRMNDPVVAINYKNKDLVPLDKSKKSDDAKAQNLGKGITYKIWDSSKRGRPVTILATEQQNRIYNKVLEARAKREEERRKLNIVPNQDSHFHG